MSKSASKAKTKTKGAPHCTSQPETDQLRSAKQRRKEQSGEAICERLELHKRQKAVARQVEQWPRVRDSLEEETKQAEAQGLSRPRRRALLRRWEKLGQRKLRLLERPGDLVRQVLEGKGKLTAVMAADHPTDADEMLWFLLNELKLLTALEELVPPPTRFDERTGKQVKRRQNYSPSVRARAARALPGCEQQPRDPRLTDQRWMSLLGLQRPGGQRGRLQAQ